jgi:RNA recognition motif-containing protein
MSSFGAVEEAIVIQDRNTGRSRGFGFVTFVDPESAAKVLNGAPHELDGRQVRSVTCFQPY